MDLYEQIILNEKFKFMRFLDKGRWSKSNNNYYTINVADKQADIESKGEQTLLTHYLGYITNRQMPFERIFEQLDYIFSQMVRDFMKKENNEYKNSIDSLLSPNHEKSFFIEKPVKSKKKGKNTIDKKSTVDYTFVSHEQESQDSTLPEITKKLQDKNNGIFYAAPRLYTTEYVSIRLCLDILSNNIFKRSFFRFIDWAIGNDLDNGLERLLYALWVLGYRSASRWERDEIQPGIARTDKYCRILKEKTEVLKDFGEKGLKSEYYIEDFSKRNSKCCKRYWAKRATCYLRDLFKDPVCAGILSKKLGEATFKELEKKIPDVLELPGDVWNNNKTFQECLRKYIMDKKQTCKLFLTSENPKKPYSPNIFIRMAYDELCKCDINNKDNVGCYPEQFDCTFDFVPKMCDAVGQANCSFCPINPEKLKEHSNRLQISEKFFHKCMDKFCPFLLFAAGYKVKCEDMKEICPNWKNQ